MSTRKILGDAGEHYAIANFSFNGASCSKMPDNWPSYDIFLQKAEEKFCISVKTRSETTSFGLNSHFKFDSVKYYEWLVCIVKYRSGIIDAWVLPINVATKYSNLSESLENNSYSYRLPFRRLKNELSRFKENWALSIRN